MSEPDETEGSTATASAMLGQRMAVRGSRFGRLFMYSKDAALEITITEAPAISVAKDAEPMSRMPQALVVHDGADRR